MQTSLNVFVMMVSQNQVLLVSLNVEQMKLPITRLENVNAYLVTLKHQLMEHAHLDAKPMKNTMEIDVFANLDVVTSRMNVQCAPLMPHPTPPDPHAFVLHLTSFSTKPHINVNHALFSPPTMMMIPSVSVMLAINLLDLNVFQHVKSMKN